jgi:hypothetical protein
VCEFTFVNVNSTYNHDYDFIKEMFFVKWNLGKKYSSWGWIIIMWKEKCVILDQNSSDGSMSWVSKTMFSKIHLKMH